MYRGPHPNHKPTNEQMEAWRLTPEEKERWGPMLRETWSAIAPDAEPIFAEYGTPGGRINNIMEMVIDADRPNYFGGMTYEENRVLGRLWVNRDRATIRWLRKELNY